MKAPDNAGNARDASLTPWRRKQQPSRHSCLENSMDRGAWQATVHRVTKSGHDWAGTQQQPMAPALLFKIFCSFILWCQRRLLKSLLDSKEIKPVNPKGNQPWCSLKGLTLKRQYFGHLMQRAGSLEKTLTLGKIEGRKRRGQQRMRWLDGIIDAVGMNLSKFQEMVKDR